MPFFFLIRNLRLILYLVPAAFIISGPIDSQTFFGVTFGRNNGKQILETGSKTPDLTGFAGGSRLTYPRNYNFLGLVGRYNSDFWTFNTRFNTTGWSRRTGNARNEDFILDEQSSIKDSGADYTKWRFRDTPYSITGSKNFADATGKSNMSSYDLETEVLFYPFQFFSREKGAQTNGFFIDVGLHYTYFKYYVYDVLQYLKFQGSFFLGPIGYGNSFTNSQIEYPFGAGYKVSIFGVEFLFGIQYINGFNTGKDFHKQRNLNFILSDSFGNGYNYRMVMEYTLSNQSTVIQTRFYGHHYYSKGILSTKGGLGNEYLIAQSGNSQGFHLATKETGYSISVLQKF